MYIVQPGTARYIRTHIQKARVPEVQTPQIILNFPQKDWLITRKLPSLQGLYSNFSLIVFNYFLNLRLKHLNILYSKKYPFCDFDDIRTIAAKFCRQDLRTFILN